MTSPRSDRDSKLAKTPAQIYCLVIGATLLIVGLLGFIADATFDTTKSLGSESSGLQGNSFLGFEVNGWHNVVHVLSGLVLLAAANSRPTAKTTAIAFGVVYGLVTIIGLIDGEDVLGFIPVNAADNVLHLLISIAGIAAGLLSAMTKRDQREHGVTGKGDRTHETTTSTSDAGAVRANGTTGRFDRTRDETPVEDPEISPRTR